MIRDSVMHLLSRNHSQRRCITSFVALVFLGMVASIFPVFPVFSEHPHFFGTPKVFFIAYGVIERPKGCAHNATVVNVIQSATLNYSIPHEQVTFAIIPSTSDYEIDGVMMTRSEANRWRSLSSNTHFKAYTAQSIDAYIRQSFCQNQYNNLDTLSVCSQPFWRDDYTETMIQHAFRMLYLEHKISKFLANVDQKALAIVYSADIILNQKIHPLDVQQVFTYFSPSTVYLTANNDADGYTDGFYFGNVLAVSKVLSSLEHLHNYARSGLRAADYEKVLKTTFTTTGTSRRVLRGFGMEMHDFIKVRASGALFATLSCHTKQLIDEAWCPKLKDVACFHDYSSKAGREI